jgi:hypothetical protein
MTLPDSAKEIIRAGALGHLVTSNSDGTPQVSCAWVAVEGDDLLTAHLNPGLRKPPRVRMRVEVTRVGGIGPWAA